MCVHFCVSESVFFLKMPGTMVNKDGQVRTSIVYKTEGTKEAAFVVS